MPYQLVNLIFYIAFLKDLPLKELVHVVDLLIGLLLHFFSLRGIISLFWGIFLRSTGT